MQCMKCGRDTESGSVFCPDCLGVMDRYPVKPGTVVQIPTRPRREFVIPVKKDKPEEIIVKLQKNVRRLTIAVAALSVSLGISIGIIAWHFSTTNHNGFSIGQNYSTETYDGFRGR